MELLKKKIGLVSSFVIQGYVGLRVAIPTVQILGGYPLVVPTAIYTTHAGIKGAVGKPIDSQIINFSLDYLFGQELDCFVSGFLGTVSTVEKIIDYLQQEKTKNSNPVILVDPILGDYPKGLYVSMDLARLVKKGLVPLARGITPNKFEAEFLSGIKIIDFTTARHAIDTLHCMGLELIVITSYKMDLTRGRIFDLVSHGGVVWEINCPLVTDKSTAGAGDMYSAALATLWSKGINPVMSAALSSALVNRSVFAAYQSKDGSINPIDPLTSLVMQIEGTEEQLNRFLKSLDIYLLKMV